MAWRRLVAKMPNKSSQANHPAIRFSGCLAQTKSRQQAPHKLLKSHPSPSRPKPQKAA
ncbi:hypothetical protein [Kingella bonacorsii]|uniref:Uncharacterized protein n=1 Tax=Kingella bonacorsii TaxID=2796361 RepID=A0ABS1BRA7_9NEIS|nr:hypothetical protein [Kingella bonacorsii]MBK0395737.1 hypothetical protein [Kingella bonacorsii]